MRPSLSLLRALAMSAVVVVAACGGGASPDDSGSGSAATAAPATVPAVDVVDLESGESIALTSVLATDRPTLLWMWAPY